MKMFEAVNFKLDENVVQNLDGDLTALAYVHPVTSVSGKHQHLALLRRFEFDSKLQRMSVIGKNLITNNNILYVKGSPEKMKELSDPSSIPRNFD